MQKRFVLWWLLMFLLVVNTFVTISINVAVVSMVSTQQIDTEDNNSPAVVCPNTTFFLKDYLDDNDEIVSENSENTKYNWSKSEQNTVLSGYYWLNYVSILPGGILSHKYGSKKVVGYAQFISSVMSSLIPITAGYGPVAVSCVRAVQGVLSFMSVPAGLFSIIGNWSPPHERGKFSASFIMGNCVGMTFGSFLFGYIGEYFRWEFTFYLTSVCGIVWSVLWYLLIHDSPAQHPTISNKEKNYIESSLNQSISMTKIPKASIPWKGIVTSVPLFVSVLGMTSFMWAFVATITYSPIYYKNFYGLNSYEIGIITSVPNILIGVVSLGLAYSSDKAIEKKWLSITGVRKVFTFVGSILSSIPLLIVAFTKCNLLLVSACLMINSVLKTFNAFGVVLVIVDLSPKFCGILEGFTGTTTSILTFAFSAVVNYLTTIYDVETLWKMVFLYTALYSIISCAIFLIFGTSEVQSWNFENDEDKEEEN